ncbi:MAG: NAD-dependent epimerase/dehydratase family protein [Desulfobacterales bacterium]|nr:NAD-dependent epimerase/dehydratase family protein [Desulfobacterales bacterium]
MQGHDFYAKKNVLITGGLGFLGSNLAIRLVGLGASVTLYDGLIADLGANFFNIEPIKEKVRVVIANIGDRSAMDQYVRHQEIVFNLGMHSCHLDSMENPVFDIQTNVVPQINFLESLRHNNPEARVVYVGTRAQYGRVENPPITEASPLNPMDIYSVSKQAVEWYHMLYGKICGLRPISLRLGNTYGPGHQMRHAKYGVQNYLIRLALDGQQIQVFGDGSQKREMIYVDDVIECLLLLGEKDQCIGEAYAIGTNERVTFLKLVQEIIKACGSGSYTHVPWPKDRKLVEVGDVVTDYSKLVAHTGWSPSIPLSQGLKITGDYYRQYKKHYW